MQTQTYIDNCDWMAIDFHLIISNKLDYLTCGESKAWYVFVCECLGICSEPNFKVWQHYQSQPEDSSLVTAWSWPHCHSTSLRVPHHFFTSIFMGLLLHSERREETWQDMTGEEMWGRIRKWPRNRTWVSGVFAQYDALVNCAMAPPPQDSSACSLQLTLLSWEQSESFPGHVMVSAWGIIVTACSWPHHHSHSQTPLRPLGVQCSQESRWGSPLHWRSFLLLLLRTSKYQINRWKDGEIEGKK